jgi:prepilin-type N-terminal cleavage/methylation domain-containing protein
MSLFFKKLKSVKGVSLIELIVALAIFSVLILSATGIFKMVIDGQRSSISAQNVQENMRYAMEKMSKEMRMAQISDQDCDVAATNKVFNTANNDQELYFKNQNGDCITYYLENNRLKVMAGAISDFVTPTKIEVSNLKFSVVDNLIGTSYGNQPYATMVMDVKAIGQAIHKQEMKIQMTVSSRYYGSGAQPICTPDCSGKVCGSDGCGGSCGSCSVGSCVAGACVVNDQTYTCSAKPAIGTEWNTVSSYTQTWNGSSWTPADSTTSYNATPDTTSCRYKCATSYTWDGNYCSGDNRTYTCSAKPTTGTDWNTVSSYTQTWSGSAWLPTDSTTSYNTTPDTTSCRYKCATNYTWNSSSCVANTQTYTCSAKPATGTIWNTVSSYTQTWNGSAWLPANSTTTYGGPSTTICYYTCDTGYAWDGGNCVILPFATGGTITYTDSSGLNPRSSPAYAGGYTVHTFTTVGNSTFVVNRSGNVTVLVVAGGGGGGWNGGGGGGAGGYQYNSSFAVTAQPYIVTVGGGGTGANTAGGTPYNYRGESGSSSSFSTITSAGGGGGGSRDGSEGTGAAGGSGGAGGGVDATQLGGSGNVPSTSPSQGNAGGKNYGSFNSQVAGGGGGSSVSGGNASSGKAGDGGSGTANSISGASVYYAGGGGGGVTTSGTAGVGGFGGGGDGTNGTSGEDGTANTGGGGGGANDGTGGNGGSGIVIIRYPSSQ